MSGDSRWSSLERRAVLIEPSMDLLAQKQTDNYLTEEMFEISGGRG